MKRYYIDNDGEPFESNIGEWVKYEPWMDEAEYRYKIFPQMSQSYETTKGKPEDPTICVKCKNINTDLTCFAYDVNYVDGGIILPLCQDKNNGNCQDYDPKESD